MAKLLIRSRYICETLQASCKTVLGILDSVAATVEVILISFTPRPATVKIAAKTSTATPNEVCGKKEQ